MSSGWRPTNRYVARRSIGTPSSGVWVLMNRRCSCAASCAYTSSRGATNQSSHGDSSPSGRGTSGVWKINRAQIICIHVVPLFDLVVITMSPSRNGKPRHRPLSSSGDR
jgi:hypothetical protein